MTFIRALPSLYGIGRVDEVIWAFLGEIQENAGLSRG